MLQWSHAQPNVETLDSPGLPGVDREASMEPRSAERGNKAAIAAGTFSLELQWSHAQPNVETLLKFV